LLTGKAVPSISLRIIREQWGSPIGSICAEQFSSLCLPTTEIGEIVVSGAHVLPGYLHGSGDSETKFDVEGVCWHRTGDLGYLDLDARLWLMGRASGKIADERGVLYPFAVECAAQIAPGVKRAALAHCPGKRILVIEAADGCQQAKLMSNLAWAQLDEIRAVRSIPMDRRHNAKVDYSALSRLVADGDRRSG
jgi:acyl-CoA synthetase (AMP-forming)/AMP-acid ligase II